MGGAYNDIDSLKEEMIAIRGKTRQESEEQAGYTHPKEKGKH